MNTVNGDDRRARLRQAAVAFAGLGSLILLNTFFAELGSRSRSLQAIELASGAAFVLISAVLLSLDIQVRRVPLSIWLARFLLGPSAWGMLILLGNALGLRARSVEAGGRIGMAQAAALINIALLSVIIVLLVRAASRHTAEPVRDARGN